MAVLDAQISNSQGLFVDSNTNIQSDTYTSIGNYLDSLLINNAHRQTVVGEAIQTLLRLNPYIQYRQSDYTNYLSRLARFFGDNAKQNTTHLIIQKSDLPSLTPKLDNTAESLLIALLVRVMFYESNSLISTTVVTFFKTEFLNLNLVPITQSILLIQLFTKVTKIELFEIVDKDIVAPNDY